MSAMDRAAIDVNQQTISPTSDNSNTGSSDVTGYPTTDALDDMLASEYSEEGPPHAAIEDELMTPVGADGDGGGEGRGWGESGGDVTAEDAGKGTEKHGEGRENTDRLILCDAKVGALLQSLEERQWRRHADVLPEIELTDATGSSEDGLVHGGEKRLILCGPLQIMGRSDIHVLGRQHSGDSAAGALSPTTSQLPPPSSPSMTAKSPVIVHFTLPPSQPSSSSQVGTSGAPLKPTKSGSESIDGLEASTDDDDDDGHNNNEDDVLAERLPETEAANGVDKVGRWRRESIDRIKIEIQQLTASFAVNDASPSSLRGQGLQQAAAATNKAAASVIRVVTAAAPDQQHKSSTPLLTGEERQQRKDIGAVTSQVSPVILLSCYTVTHRMMAAAAPHDYT